MKRLLPPEIDFVFYNEIQALLPDVWVPDYLLGGLCPDWVSPGVLEAEVRRLDANQGVEDGEPQDLEEPPGYEWAYRHLPADAQEYVWERIYCCDFSFVDLLPPRYRARLAKLAIDRASYYLAHLAECLSEGGV